MIKGKLGTVKIGAVAIAEMATWSYSGDVRDPIEAPEVYDSTHIESFAGTKKGGDIDISGMLKIADAGQILAKTRFDANTEMADLYLYIDATHWLVPDSGTTEPTRPASKAFFTKVTAIEHAASGVVMVSISAHVSGAMVHGS